MSKNFSGYVLAGGKSSRMGVDKAFLQIGGKTFIENAASALKPKCEQVKIVLNRSQTHFVEKLPENIEYIVDRFENRGALGGIHAALKDCETEFALILAVDLPFVDESAIQKLCEFALNSEDVSAIVPRQNDGRLQPLCAVYQAQNCLPKIEQLIKKTSVSVKDFLKLVPVYYIDENELTTSTNRNLFLNINYPTDLQELI